jgi:hypothetical protein
MTRYEINISEFDNSEIIKRINDDGSESWIPKNTANSDYQQYLKWVEEQNA